MNQYKITFKRVENFYNSILIMADNEEQARIKADELSTNGEIVFDFMKESEILDEYIAEIQII